MKKKFHKIYDLKGMSKKNKINKKKDEISAGSLQFL